MILYQFLPIGAGFARVMSIVHQSVLPPEAERIQTDKRSGMLLQPENGPMNKRKRKNPSNRMEVVVSPHGTENVQGDQRVAAKEKAIRRIKVRVDLGHQARLANQRRVQAGFPELLWPKMTRYGSFLEILLVLIAGQMFRLFTRKHIVGAQHTVTP